MAETTVVAMVGSLRRASYNRLLLGAARELAPAGMTVTEGVIGTFPLYNEDVLTAGMPAAVQAVKTQIAEADGVLFITPEYNFSVPGVLKNAIDWLSRPPGTSPFGGKPGAIMGASPGRFGTVRSQYHLRQVLLFADMRLLNGPDVMLAHADSLFDASGRLVDERSRDAVRQLLAALAREIARAG